MTRYVQYLVLMIIVTVLLCGCGAAAARVDLRSYPNPVMVSPITRIGDTAKVALNDAIPFSTFSTEAKSAGSGAGGSHYENHGGTTYQVYESVSAWSRSDRIWDDLRRATANRDDLVVVVDDLQAGFWIHCSLIGLFRNWVGLEGRVFDPKYFERSAR